MCKHVKYFATVCVNGGSSRFYRGRFLFGHNKRILERLVKAFGRSHVKPGMSFEWDVRIYREHDTTLGTVVASGSFFGSRNQYVRYA